MSQTDVLKYLRELRLAGDESFFCCESLRKKLRTKNVVISSQAIYYNVMRLMDKGFLEVNGKWPRRFRFKKL